jgi:hypothetical protein
MSMPSPGRASQAARGWSMHPPPQQLARITGVLFILTFITSIAGLLLYDPVLNHTDFITGAGSETRVELGALCEVFLAITNIGTAVALFPILKRQNEALSLGFVASRIVESTIIVVGLISLLAVVTLRDDLAGAAGTDAATLTTVGRSLVALHDWTFLMGPGFCVGIGNGLILGYLMYRSGLMPRRLTLFGLIGGPVIFASSIAVLFGAYEQSDAVHFIFSIPEIIWELSLAIYLTAKGFKPDAPILQEPGNSAVATAR